MQRVTFVDRLLSNAARTIAALCCKEKSPTWRTPSHGPGAPAAIRLGEERNRDEQNQPSEHRKTPVFEANGFRSSGRRLGANHFRTICDARLGRHQNTFDRAMESFRSGL